MNIIPQPEPPSTVVPWTLRDVMWGLVGFVVWLLLFGLISFFGREWQLPLDNGLIIVFGEAILLLPVWYFTIHKYGASWADLGLRGFRPGAVGLGCGFMVISVVFNLGYLSLLRMFDSNIELQPGLDQIFDKSEFPLAIFLGAAVVAPFVEEIFFRGFIFSGLRNRWDWKKAALASAGLFALAHILPTSLLPIFVLGLIFAFLYQKSGSIWPGILMHMLTNSIAIVMAYAISQGWKPPA
ncbi:MAG: type II CAAX endopeptidase family protein [Anaerolineae bacterium]